MSMLRVVGRIPDLQDLIRNATKNTFCLNNGDG